MMMIVHKWGIIFWKLMKKVYCKPSKVNVNVTVKNSDRILNAIPVHSVTNF